MGHFVSVTHTDTVSLSVNNNSTLRTIGIVGATATTIARDTYGFNLPTGADGYHRGWVEYREKRTNRHIVDVSNILFNKIATYTYQL